MKITILNYKFPKNIKITNLVRFVIDGTDGVGIYNSLALLTIDIKINQVNRIIPYFY